MWQLRRSIHKIIHATRDKGHARRLMAILLLHEGRTITDVHHLTGAARSTIGRWLRWYRDEGVGALEALPARRAPVLPVAKIVTLLVLLMQFSPQDFGYQLSRWCTELLAIKINRLTGLNMAASTLRRWLPRMGIVWRRPVPTLRIKDQAYQEKMANIDAALAHCDADNPVFYEDEVDIDLNPKLGADWMFRAQQSGLSHRDRTPNITWLASPCRQHLRPRDKEKLIAVYHHAGKAASPLPTRKNHHADP